MTAVERLDAEEARLALVAALDALEDASQARFVAMRAETRARHAHDAAVVAYYAACAEMNS